MCVCVCMCALIVAIFLHFCWTCRSQLYSAKRKHIPTDGEPSSVALDLTPTVHPDVTPSLKYVAVTPKGIRFVAACFRKLAEWRAFFTMHNDAPSLTQPKLPPIQATATSLISIQTYPLVAW